MELLEKERKLNTAVFSNASIGPDTHGIHDFNDIMTIPSTSSKSSEKEYATAKSIKREDDYDDISIGSSTTIFLVPLLLPSMTVGGSNEYVLNQSPLAKIKDKLDLIYQHASLQFRLNGTVNVENAMFSLGFETEDFADDKVTRRKILDHCSKIEDFMKLNQITQVSDTVVKDYFGQANYKLKDDKKVEDVVLKKKDKKRERSSSSSSSSSEEEEENTKKKKHKRKKKHKKDKKKKDKKKKEKKRERSSSSSEEDGNAKKSTAALCYFYAQGRCRNGENCFYSHEQS